MSYSCSYTVKFCVLKLGREMDDSNYPRNRHNEHLGVNKMGKGIRKSPLLQSDFVDPARPVSQPQVYNINKNDFRNIVQQLTGSPSHHSQQPLPVPRPPVTSPSMRLQRIRPPPLSPININRPQMPIQVPLNDNNNNNQARHDQVGQFGQPLQRTMVAAESPLSSYMRYLQHSINDPANPQTQSAGLLPNPSPNSQFLLPSPSSYLNLSSPQAPYSLLSPGYQHPPQLTPNFPFSPGILGPGSRPPLSPGISFPLSPGFFPALSPRWRD